MSFGIFLSLIIFLIFISAYLQKTMELSLQKRWKLVNLINEVKDDENYGTRFKVTLLHMLNDASSRNLLPKLIFFLITNKIFNRDLEKSKKEFEEEVLSNHAEHEMYKKAMRIMFEINCYSAPHWYILALILGAIFIVFSKFLKVFNFNNIERSLFYNYENKNKYSAN